MRCMGAAGESGGPPTVLIVDDDKDVRDMARTSLEVDGRFAIIGEGIDGWEAIRLAADHQPDLVLLDLEMPWLNGAEAVPHIRAAAPSSLIALWTVAPESHRATEALALGASAVLDKSMFSAGSLASRLAQLLVGADELRRTQSA